MNKLFTKAFGIPMASISLSLLLLSLFTLSPLINQKQPVAHAATSSNLNFQSRLLTSSGNTVPDGNYHIEFKLYNANNTTGSSQGSCSGDANCLWTETRTTGNLVRVVNGYLTVNLGSVTAFPSTIDWDQEHWLGMRVGGSAGGASWETIELTTDGTATGGKLKLTAVPYAFKAGQLAKRTGAFTSTLDFATQTGSRVILLPDGSGTVCLQTASACGFATTTGGSGYIQNATSLQTSANFNIQSAAAGSVGGSIQAAVSQTANLLNLVGTSTTTTFDNRGNLGLTNSNTANQDGYISINGGAGQQTEFIQGFYGNTFFFKNAVAANAGGTGVKYVANGTVSYIVQDNVGGIHFGVSPSGTAGNDVTLSYVQSIGNNGDVTFRNRVDTASAFQVQNSNGDQFINVDTTNANLLSNSSFENSNITSWQAKGSATRTRDTSDKFVGNASLRIDNSATVGDGVKYPVGLATGNLYFLAFYTKDISGTPYGTLNEVGYSEDGVTETPCTTFAAYGVWRKVFCSFTTGTVSGSPYIYIKQGEAVAHSFYIDAVYLDNTMFLSDFELGKISLNGTVNSPTIFRNQSDSEHAFQIQSAGGGSTLFDVNTADNIINSAAALNVTGPYLQSGPVTIDNAGASTYISSDSMYALYVANSSEELFNVDGSNGDIRIGGASSSGTIQIGGATSAGQIDIATGTGAQTINLGTGSTGSKTINIGGTASNAIRIGDTQTSGSISLGAAMVAGTTTIGGTGTTGTITLGRSTATNTIAIGSANPLASSTQTINIGNGGQSTASSVINVNILSGVAGSNGTARLNLANNDRVTQIDIGNVVADAARTINVGVGNSTAVDTFNIGTGATTVAGGKTIHIGDGTPTGSGTNLITIGTLTNASTTTIRGGTGATAVSIQAANGATILMGTTTTANTSIGNTTGTLTLQGGASSTIALGGTTISAAELNLLDGHDVALVDTNDAVATAITGTGALGAGSITSGFGAIDTGADDITTTGTVAGGTVNATTGTIQTNSTNRIDNSGNLVNIGTVTTSGAINSQTISSTASFTGTVDLVGSLATKKGTDYSTVGSTNNVNLGDVSLVRLTGASAQTITGISGGRDGEQLTLVNAASQSAILANASGSSSASNQIITGTGANITIPAGGSVTLIYDSGASYWRVIGSVAFSTGNFIQNGTSTQTTANFNIQSAGSASVGGVIRGATSQTADLLQLQDSAGTILTAFDNTGALVFGPSGAQDTNLYRQSANLLKTDDSLDVGSQLTVRMGGGSKQAIQIVSVAANTGITIGGDTNIYRSAADNLTTDDSLNVTGLLTANGNLTLQAGDTFTINGDALTDLTGSGLTVSGNALTIDATSATGFFRNGGNSFAGSATLGTNDANVLNLETNSTNRFQISASASTITGQGTTRITSTGDLAVNAAAAGQLDIGNTTTNSNINIGNVTGTTGLVFYAGTGGMDFTSYNGIYLSATDNIELTANVDTNISSGGNTSVTSNDTIVTSQNNSANAFQVKNSSAVSQFNVNATSGLVTVDNDLAVNGGDITSTGGLTVQAAGSNSLILNTAGAGTVSLGTTNTTTVGIGNTGAAVTIQGNATSGAVSVQASAGGTIAIGSTTDAILNLGTGATTNAITIGGTTTAGQITLGRSTVTNTISIGSANGTTATQTIDIAGGTSTTSGGKVVNIANGTPGAGTTNTVAIGTGGSTTGTVGVTIGSNAAAGHTVTIQGGNTSSAITLQSAASGSINIGTNNVATKTINMGSGGSQAQDTTVNIANSTAGVQTVGIGSINSTSTTTVRGGSLGVTIQTGGTTGSATAFQLQNAAGTETYFQVDNSNSGATNTITIGGNNSGKLGAWTTNTSNPLIDIMGYQSTVTANGYIYAIGGIDGTARTQVSYAKVNTNGSIGVWTYTEALPSGRGEHSSIVANGYVYVIGGYDGTAINDVLYSKLNADGTLGDWNYTTDLPYGLDSHSTVAANGYVYIIGGFDGTNNHGDVYSAKLNADGTVGAWNATVSLPGGERRTWTSSVTYNGYVYVMGGKDNGGAYRDTVYYARLNTDGTVGAWSTTSTLTQPRAIGSAVVANGYVYYIGGENTSTNNVQSTVYYAKINTDGTFAGWNSTTAITAARDAHSSVVINGYVYVLGGYSGSAWLDSIYYASTQRILMGGSLDLVSLGAGTLADGESGLGGSLTAGNTNIVGSLDVKGATNLGAGVNVTGNSSFNLFWNTGFNIQDAVGNSMLKAVNDPNGSFIQLGHSYLSLAGVPVPVNPTVASANDAGATLAVDTYYYRVASYDISGLQSVAVATSPVSLTNPDTTTRHTISWTPVAGAAGYVVDRSSDGGATFTRENVGNVSSIIDNGITYDWVSGDYAANGRISYSSSVTLQDAGAVFFDIDNYTYINKNQSRSSLDIINLSGDVQMVGDNLVFQSTATYQDVFGITTGGEAWFGVEGADSATAFNIQSDSEANLFVVNSTTSRVHIGDPTADANAVQLVLDNKNTSGDPTGVDGAMYYNSNAGRFRCYEAGAWKECNHRTVVRLGSDQGNSNAVANTMEDVTGLSWSVTANTMYSFSCTIYYTSAATTTGSRWGINGPTGSGMMQSEYTLTSTTSTINAMVQAYDSPATSSASSAAGTNLATLSGFVVPTSSGTVIVRHASEVSGSAITAKAGSNCEWW